MAGYYERSLNPDDKKKDPWFIHAATPLWTAGLWEDASRLLGENNLGTFTVITGASSASSGVSGDIHDRMPVWLAPGEAEEWMQADTDRAMAMLLASEPAMEEYRVSRAVNSPRNNRDALLDAFASPHRQE
jgi:putative SOS response-associated peptidase YedK